MQAIIFADHQKKSINQELMKWSLNTHIKFQMFFVTDKKTIENLVKSDKLIIVYNDKAAKILKSLNKKHIVLTDNFKGLPNV